MKLKNVNYQIDIKPWKGDIFIENNNYPIQKLQRSEILIDAIGIWNFRIGIYPNYLIFKLTHCHINTFSN